jgi:hypothetical protein
MTTLSLRLPDELDAEVTALAARDGRSKNAEILVWVQEGIERARQADIDHDDAMIAELLAFGGGATISGEQVAADYAAVRAEREAELAERYP